MPFLFDPVRGKNVKALPEERIRSQLVRWLVESARVPARLISVEYVLRLPDSNRHGRADVVVWIPAGGGGGLRPWLLAECKAPGIVLDAGVADQVRRYAQSARAEHVLLTNGSETRIFSLRNDRYVETEGLPFYPAP